MDDDLPEVADLYLKAVPRPATSIHESDRRSLFVVCFKYVISSMPLALGFALAAWFWNLSQREVHANLLGMDLTPRSSSNIAAIFVFAGGVFAALFSAFNAFRDWRAWDDRRQLMKALAEDDIGPVRSQHPSIPANPPHRASGR